MRKKFDSQSQIRILLFVVFIVGAIVSITSVSLYLLYNDSHKQIENLNAVYQESNSSVDLKDAFSHRDLEYTMSHNAKEVFNL